MILQTSSAKGLFASPEKILKRFASLSRPTRLGWGAAFAEGACGVAEAGCATEADAESRFDSAFICSSRAKSGVRTAVVFCCVTFETPQVG